MTQANSNDRGLCLSRRQQNIEEFLCGLLAHLVSWWFRNERSSTDARLFCANRFEVRIHHHLHQLLETDLRLPAEFSSGLRSIRQ